MSEFLCDLKSNGQIGNEKYPFVEKILFSLGYIYDIVPLAVLLMSVRLAERKDFMKIIHQLKSYK